MAATAKAMTAVAIQPKALVHPVTTHDVGAAAPPNLPKVADPYRLLAEHVNFSN
jgi:hypothetical protein